LGSFSEDMAERINRPQKGWAEPITED